MLVKGTQAKLTHERQWHFPIIPWWRHDMETLSTILAFCERESTGHWWILPMEDQQCRALMFYLLLAWTNCWTNNPFSSDLRGHDANVMSLQCIDQVLNNMAYVWHFIPPLHSKNRRQINGFDQCLWITLYQYWILLWIRHLLTKVLIKCCSKSVHKSTIFRVQSHKFLYSNQTEIQHCKFTDNGNYLYIININSLRPRQMADILQTTFANAVLNEK